MTSYLKKVQTAISFRTTYRVGLLQTKAYRLLKQRTTVALAPFGIVPPEWAFLGVLRDTRVGLRLALVAEALGVNPPFVTIMLRKLTKKGFVEISTDEDDSRLKIICLTDKGRDFVKDMEQQLKVLMRPVAKDIALSDLLTYFSVLEKMVQNAERTPL